MAKSVIIRATQKLIDDIKARVLKGTKLVLGLGLSGSETLGEDGGVKINIDNDALKQNIKETIIQEGLAPDYEFKGSEYIEVIVDGKTMPTDETPKEKE